MEKDFILDFEKLSKVECKVEKKGRFNYISWADAWKELKKIYPNANYRVYESETTIKKGDVTKKTKSFVFQHNDEGFVKVGVMINNIEHIEIFPILNNYNKPISNPNVFDVNTSIKRALAKAIAQFGLGLYVYSGEDLPEQ